MVYQMGTNKVSQFEKTLQLLEEKNYEAAKKEAMNSKWAQQTPERADTVSSMFNDTVPEQFINLFENKQQYNNVKKELLKYWNHPVIQAEQKGTLKINPGNNSSRGGYIGKFKSFEDFTNYWLSFYEDSKDKDLYKLMLKDIDDEIKGAEKWAYKLNFPIRGERGWGFTAPSLDDAIEEGAVIETPTTDGKVKTQPEPVKKEQPKTTLKLSPVEMALKLANKKLSTQVKSNEKVFNTNQELIGPKFDSTYVSSPLQTKVETKVKELPSVQQPVIKKAVEQLVKEDPSIIESIKATTTNTAKEAEILANNIVDWGKRFAVKKGLLNPEEVETEKVYDVPLPKKHTYVPPSERGTKNRDDINPDKFTKIGVTNNKHLMFSNTFDLRKGFNYIPIKNVGNSKLTDEYLNVEGIAHFILDADVASEYQHEYAKNDVAQQRKSPKPVQSPGSTIQEAYVPVTTKNNDGSVNVTYKPQSQLSKNDKVYSILRQYKFTDIAWDKAGKPAPNKGFKDTVSGLYTVNGQVTNLIYPTGDKEKQSYGKFGGASVVFIIPEKNIAIDFAGSLKQIKEMGENLASEYKIKKEDLIIGHHDVGSFSAKPAANEKGVLKFSQWSGFNTNSFTGGALAIPKQK